MVSTRISKTLIGVLIETSDKFVKKKTLNSNLHLSFFIFFFFFLSFFIIYHPFLCSLLLTAAVHVKNPMMI